MNKMIVNNKPELLVAFDVILFNADLAPTEIKLIMKDGIACYRILGVNKDGGGWKDWMKSIKKIKGKIKRLPAKCFK